MAIGYNGAMATYPEPAQPLALNEVLRSLPPEYGDEGLAAQIRSEMQHSGRKVVVLDDDPTGPQAMCDVFTLTEWPVEALRRELLQERPLFFVLANTRALPAARAVARVREIAADVREAARQSSVEYTLMIRGDSTLRGHFPDEEEALGPFDGRVLIPFFAEGGRFTFSDVQWVGEVGVDGSPILIPAAWSPYAKDSTFGYRHSNLRNWVEEKSRGTYRASDVMSLSLDTVRRQGPDAITDSLLLSRRHTTIANAMSYRDLEVVALGLLRAEQQGKRYIVRCAASFVRVRAGQSAVGPPMSAMSDLVSEAAVADSTPTAKGGLIIIGSHVPRTNVQLDTLLHEPGIEAEELQVSALMGDSGTTEVDRISNWLNTNLSAGRHVVVFTSRDVEPRGTEVGLSAGETIVSALVEIVRRLRTRPRFMLVKGGWTSSEIGLRALNVKRAYSPAPILPGVPMWLLGTETRYPGMPYVIFPGNVGNAGAVTAVVHSLSL
jgi:uncharacterized protein YgbK (DUF1537 family)